MKITFTLSSRRFEIIALIFSRAIFWQFTHLSSCLFINFYFKYAQIAFSYTC